MTEPLNLMDPNVLSDPHPYYAELRKKPIGQVQPFNIWAISRYDDLIAALKHPALSSGAWSAMLQPPWLPRNPLANTLGVLDGPAHARLRKLVSGPFAGAGLARIEARIRLMADVLAEQVVARHEFDFVNDFALALPAHVIGDLLGLPPHLHPNLKKWTSELISVPLANHSDEDKARIRDSVAMMEHFLGEVIEARRVDARDDMISDLLRAKSDGEAITSDEMMSFCFILTAAGMETTSNLLGHAAALLSERPGLFEKVTANRGWIIPQFIDEVLRYETPIPMLLRAAIAPTVIDGVEIPTGSMVALLIPSALRDEKYFKDPDEFIIERDNSRNSVAFGHGIHFCLGAMLARLEARFGLEALLLRSRGMHRAPGKIQYSHGFGSRVMVSLPMSIDPK